MRSFALATFSTGAPLGAARCIILDDVFTQLTVQVACTRLSLKMLEYLKLYRHTWRSVAACISIQTFEMRCIVLRVRVQCNANICVSREMFE